MKPERSHKFERLEESEDEPEWGDFDPEKESSSFFGRKIEDENELRDEIKREREAVERAQPRRDPEVEDAMDEMALGRSGIVAEDPAII